MPDQKTDKALGWVAKSVRLLAAERDQAIRNERAYGSSVNEITDALASTNGRGGAGYGQALDEAHAQVGCRGQHLEGSATSVDCVREHSDPRSSGRTALADTCRRGRGPRRCRASTAGGADCRAGGAGCGALPRPDVLRAVWSRRAAGRGRGPRDRPQARASPALRRSPLKRGARSSRGRAMFTVSARP